MLATSECPRQSQPADTRIWSGLFSHYRAGHLWASGGVSDQPQVYLDIMKTLEYWADKLAP